MANETLRGWNAIADFLSCDVRTAKRWEQYRHLPVHRTRRTPGEGRANVYAVSSELEIWLASANALAESPQLSAQQEDNPAEALLHLEKLPATVSSAPPGSHRNPTLILSACIALTVVVLIVAAARHRVGETPSAIGNSGKAARPIPPPTPEEARAQELYLHGSYLFEQRTPETLQQAQLDFQAAIAASPKYAPAYAGLAKTYALLREYSTLPSAQAYTLAKQAAQQAIALDPKLADAHAALAYEQFFWEWDARRAEAEFKQAIALDPNSTLAHHWYGSMLTHQTRFAEAIEQLNQAQLLDPDSAGILGSRAYALGLSGKRDQAVDLLQDILTRVPDSAPLHFTLAELCLQQPRDIPRYLDQMRRFAELRHNDETLAVLKAGESAYRSQGEQKMWQAMLRVERQLHPNAEHPTYFMVDLEAAQGMKDAALRDLAILLRNHDEHMIGIEIDALLSSLRGNPRFARIASQVGLPLSPAPSLSAALNQ
jgi:tetratricopeptide (TPR) repeat protein